MPKLTQRDIGKLVLINFDVEKDEVSKILGSYKTVMYGRILQVRDSYVDIRTWPIVAVKGNCDFVFAYPKRRRIEQEKIKSYEFYRTKKELLDTWISYTKKH